MTSSTKPETHNVLHYHDRATGIGNMYRKFREV